MSTERLLPKEWSSLPRWVKEELLYGAPNLFCYSGYIQRLVDHGENMKGVWRLFETRRHTFTGRRPVYSLLSMLNEAGDGLDPGLRRSDDDRKAVAGYVETHVTGLLTQISRLGSGAKFGQYPLEVTNVVGLAAWENAQEKLSEPFKEASVGITGALDSAAVDPDVKKHILGHVEWLYLETERLFMELHSDPRPSIKALAAGTKEWEITCKWGKSDAIWHIGSKLKYWFEVDQFAAAATLATAIHGEDVSEASVSSVMKARRKLQSLRNVKVKSKINSCGSDRPD